MVNILEQYEPIFCQIDHFNIFQGFLPIENWYRWKEDTRYFYIKRYI